MRLETGSTVIAITGRTLPDGTLASHAYRGDSGGACLSEGDVPVLVGIVSMGAKNKRGEPVSLCMSIDSHRAWLERLRKELESQPTRDCEAH
jgi:secreted trypsin-like serine protease